MARVNGMPGVEQEVAVAVSAAVDSNQDPRPPSESWTGQNLSLLAIPTEFIVTVSENSQVELDIAEPGGVMRIQGNVLSVWGEFTQGIVIGASFTGLFGTLTYFLCFCLFGGFFYDQGL